MKIFNAILAGVLIPVVSTFASQYLEDRQVAEKLLAEKKPAEALEVFVKLADTYAAVPSQKTDALEQACLIALQFKQYDRALDLAGKIPEPAVSKACQMRVLEAKRDWRQIITSFKSEDISIWPENQADIGFYFRGLAYARLGDQAQAISDLEKAAENGADGDNEIFKGRALCELGVIYTSLKEYQKAIDAYGNAQNSRIKGTFMLFNAIISRAALFSKLGKYEEALEELNKIDLAALSTGAWKSGVLRAYGDIYEAKGDKKQALEKYTEAISVTNAPPSDLAALKKKLEIVNP
ncbi:MAG: tetratricopeptide repeat protein [bacterium]